MTFRFFARATLLLGSVGGLVIACSSAPSVEDYCAKLKTRYDTCPNDGVSSNGSGPDGGASTPTRDPFNQTRCTNDHACLTGVFESAVTNAFLDCATVTDCTVSTNKCNEQAFAAGSHATEADVCAKKYAECKAAKGSSFSDDYCVNVRGMTSDSLSKVMPCFDKPCDQIKNCIEASVKAIAPSCDL